MNTCPLHNSCFLKHLTRCLKTLHTVIVYPLHCKKMEEPNDNDKYEYVHFVWWMAHPPLSILIYWRSRDKSLMWSGRLLDPELDNHPISVYLFHQSYSCYHVFSTNMASQPLAHLCNCYIELLTMLSKERTVFTELSPFSPQPCQHQRFPTWSLSLGAAICLQLAT